MAVQPLWLQNLDYPARWDRTVFDNLWTEGVITSGSFVVTETPVPTMAVDVSAGVAVVTGTDQAFQGKYVCREEIPTLAVSIGAAPGSGQRNDLIVLRVNDTNAGGAAGDNAVIDVVVGTPAGSPVDPTPPPSSLVLARVRVPAGTGTITNSLIDDLRVRASVINATSPVGTVSLYAGLVAPDGWLMCDGSAVSETTYPALYSLIGGIYNTMGGLPAPSAGLFRVPNMVGRVAVGRDSLDVDFTLPGQTGGAKTHTLVTGEMPSHSHVQDAHSHIQNSHTHTQNSHTHSQNPHSHGTDPAGSHSHTESYPTNPNVHTHDVPARQTSSTGHTHTGSQTVAAGMSGTDVLVPTFSPNENIFPSIDAGGSHSHVVQSATASNVSATATNVAATAINQTTTATNQNAGGGGAHNNLQPYGVLNYIIKF